VDAHYARVPIIKVWNLLLIPLQGEMTDELANELTNEVLDRIHQLGCSGMVIDITGLWIVDSHLCAVLSQLSSAAALMGARTFISGMKPDIALALETMGVQLKGVSTTLDLEDALERLGIHGPSHELDNDNESDWPSERLAGESSQPATPHVADAQARKLELGHRTQRTV
jgi:rsbT antagonist protein RsbS